MHIAEGFLPPAHAIGWTIAAAPFVVHGARAVVREVRENPESTLLLGAAGAFTFVLSAIKLPSVDRQLEPPDRHRAGRRPVPTAGDGAAGHDRAAVPGAAAGARRAHHARRQRVLDGDRRTVGRLRRLPCSPGGSAGDCCRGVFAAMAVADLATYVTTALQLAWAHPDAESGFLGAAVKFLGVFAVTQIPLAIGEGLLGVLLFRVLTANARPELERLGVLTPRPDVPDGLSAESPDGGPVRRRHVVTALLVLAVVALFAAAAAASTAEPTTPARTARRPADRSQTRATSRGSPRSSPPAPPRWSPGCSRSRRPWAVACSGYVLGRLRGRRSGGRPGDRPREPASRDRTGDRRRRLGQRLAPARARATRCCSAWAWCSARCCCPVWPGSVLVGLVAVVLALGPARVPARTFGRAVRCAAGVHRGRRADHGRRGGRRGVGWAPDAAAQAGSLVGHAVAGSAAVLCWPRRRPMSDLLPGAAAAAGARGRGRGGVVDLPDAVRALTSLTTIREAQTARMGYASVRGSYRSSGALAAAVLTRSWDRARRLQDGLAGRGLETGCGCCRRRCPPPAASRPPPCSGWPRSSVSLVVG